MAGKGKSVRFVALAIATGTLVSAGAGTASAAPVTHRLAATGAGSAIDVVINVPTLLQSVLGSRIEEKIAFTNGRVSTVLATPLAATAAVLADGNLPDLVQGVLAPYRSAASLTQTTGQRSLLDINQPGFTAQVAREVSSAATPASDGVSAQSDSAIERIALGGLPSGLPLGLALAPLTTQVTNDLGAAGAAGPALGNLLTGALNQVNQVAAGTPAQGVAAQLAAGLITDKLSGLDKTLLNLSAATNIVSMNTLTSNQTVTRAGNQVTSTVTNAVHNLNVLNGLVKIDAISSTASATAGGLPGTASATTSTVQPLINVSLASGALTLTIDQNGVTTVAGTVPANLPAPVASTVNTAIDTATATLQKLIGYHLDQFRAASHTATADGTAAAAGSAVNMLTVNPPALFALGLSDTRPLLTIKFVQSDATANNEIATSSIPVTPIEQSATPKLPRTGVELPAVGLLATVLMGGAMIVRRRRSAL